MKFVLFHLMPYRDLDFTEAKKFRSVWTVMPNSNYDPQKGATEYEDYIDQLVAGERLGYDVIAVNEHHQTPYGMMPAPNLIASALIQRTKTVKIGVFGRALPLVSNPLNIAEEFAMLDNMSRGRLIAGFVRGIGAEYHTTGVNPAFSHQRFYEAHELIVKAWTEVGPFAHEGDHYNFSYVNVWPRPFQLPHPPIWIPSQGSAETIRWAAAPERKYPFVVTFSTADAVANYLKVYRSEAKGFGYEASSDQLGWAAPIYVADTDERAREEARIPLQRLFNDYLPMPWEMLIPPGYSSMSSTLALAKVRTGIGVQAQTLEELIEKGTVVVGSPRTVRERIEAMREKTGLGNMICLQQFGTLSSELAYRNMEMFASEVMPALRDGAVSPAPAMVGGL
ncbi:LLM class flavin-dependent oxidoreductase [Bradyrhizobium canariense]|uniref:Flavin-dependent oxidoreductase, luciferase family (Includes alkanesulfonate monooxygenase SsuD and methylene tetrahydromethanopterin reductase) n=1 Tax=Bradyrhizobium canariense TaxID=255045 RepID=A0A1H1XPD4_9BRAD|nr:LLM class flavin-dependent oxidoreductase [Bradyrhizobium canariense]SDT10931.1 Flavin-dependent oxidoreductase, luciferase family (includes alkanesulfonate monooxygenase SsuD and methylene tetrahydromethanopterin reductase) [Bradyrhizobium canariense]